MTFAVFRRLRKRCRRHHPATRVLAFGLEVDGLALLQQLESGRPELQVQDFALARQHVVLDAQAQHGLEMRVDDGVGHHARQFGLIAPPASMACSVALRQASDSGESL